VGEQDDLVTGAHGVDDFPDSLYDIAHRVFAVVILGKTRHRETYANVFRLKVVNLLPPRLMRIGPPMQHYDSALACALNKNLSTGDRYRFLHRDVPFRM
jgi:hypothetical protein